MAKGPQRQRAQGRAVSEGALFALLIPPRGESGEVEMHQGGHTKPEQSGWLFVQVGLGHQVVSRWPLNQDGAEKSWTLDHIRQVERLRVSRTVGS